MVKPENTKEGMTVYEVGFLILPSIPEDKLTGIVDAIRAIVTKEGGIEIDSEAPFKRPLAYEMSKTVGASRYVLQDAYFGWLKFEVRPESISKIKSGMEKLDEILRFLIIKAPRETTFTFAKTKALATEKMENNGEDMSSSSVEEVMVN
jgi:ribosomal protein S6